MNHNQRKKTIHTRVLQRQVSNQVSRKIRGFFDFFFSPFPARFHWINQRKSISNIFFASSLLPMPLPDGGHIIIRLVGRLEERPYWVGSRILFFGRPNRNSRTMICELSPCLGCPLSTRPPNPPRHVLQNRVAHVRSSQLHRRKVPLLKRLQRTECR